MKTRIRELRKYHKLTQAEFGEKIGVKQVTIAGYENGIREPSDAIIMAIEREFPVNPKWLREGEGDMIYERERSDLIAEFLGDVEMSNDPFKRKIIAGLAALDENDWKNLKTIIEKMVEKMAGEE